MFLAFASAPLVSLVSATFGQSRRTRNIYGQSEWVEVGNLSQSLGWVFLAASVLLSATMLFQKSRSSGKQSRVENILILGVLATILLSVLWNWGQWDQVDLAKLLIFLFCSASVFAVGVPTDLSLTLSKLSAGLVLATAVFALVNTNYSVTECRSDKCTEFGILLNSFFPHENFLAMYLAACLPFLRLFKNFWFRNSITLVSVLLIYMSGSRIIYLAIALYFAWSFFKKFRRMALAIPLSAVLSLVVFLTVRGTDFTDRGLIYSALWTGLSKSWIFGTGPNSLEIALANGDLPGFLPSHEHGFAPHVISNFGLLTFVALILFLVVRTNTLSGGESPNYRVIDVLPLLVLSLTFSTETPIVLTYSAAFSWAWFLFLSRNLRDDEGAINEQIKIQSANPYNRSPASPKPGTM